MGWARCPAASMHLRNWNDDLRAAIDNLYPGMYAKLAAVLHLPHPGSLEDLLPVHGGNDRNEHELPRTSYRLIWTIKTRESTKFCNEGLMKFCEGLKAVMLL